MYGAACLSIQPLLLNAISVPVLGYIIHRLGADGYAQWMVAASLLSVCAVLANLGLRAAFVRAVAADQASAARALSEQLGVRLPLSLLVGALVIGLCLLLGYPPAVVWCAAAGAIGLILTTVATTLGDLLQSFNRVATLAAVNLVAGLTLTGLSLVVAWRGGGPVAMATGYLVGPAVSVATLVVIVRRHICPVAVRWDARCAARLLAGSRYFAAQQLLFAGSAQAEALILPQLIGLSQFGSFSSGAMPANRLIVLPDSLCAAAYPAMVKACAGGAPFGAGLVRRYLAVGLLGGVLVAMGGMLAADPIGRVLLPGQSELFVFAVRVTIWSVPLTALELVMGYALNAAGKDAVQARLAMPAAALSLAGSVALVLGLGVPGACWSMLFRPALRAMFLAPITVRTFRRARSTDVPVAAMPVLQPAHLLRKAG